MSEAVAERVGLPTVYEWQAGQIERTASLVAFWVSTTPEDRLAWIPSTEGIKTEARSIYDQINECAQVNRRFANMLIGVENGPWIAEPPYATSEEAQNDLKASAAEAATIIRGLDEEALARSYPTGRSEMAGSEILSLILSNMSYHGGQINLIQMLLGDGEFRFPTS